MKVGKFCALMLGLAILAVGASPVGGAVFYDTIGDGLWATAANWSTGSEPNATETASISAADCEIASIAAEAYKIVTANGHELILSSGSLTTSAANNEDIGNGTFTITGGVYTSPGGDVYIGLYAVGPGILNVSGGKANIANLYVPHLAAGSVGIVNLSGGEIEVTNSLTFDWGGQSGTMDITGSGLFRLHSSNAADKLNDFIANGDIITTTADANMVLWVTEINSTEAIVQLFAAEPYYLTYTAGANGTITGPTSQVLYQGEDGQAVTAMADAGYYFAGWSDGVADNPRTDLNVTADIDVTANFTVMSSTQAPFTIVSGGTGPANIIINSTDTDITDAANDLADKLGAISGATFSVASALDGSYDIVVGLESDFTNLPFEVTFSDGPDPNLSDPVFLREQYIIRSTADGVWLIGKTPLAVQHAVWDLLYQFGYRQYFPRSTWEYIPSNGTLIIDMDKEETPDYRSRRIWYNGSWLQGYPEWDNVTAYEEWAARNRMAVGFDLSSGHDYERMVIRNQSDFNANPQYYALVGGVRESYHGNVKLCIDNPGLVAISNADAVNDLIANPGQDSISREPSDGGGWCECDGVYHATYNPDSTNCTGNFSSISDRALYLSNQAAQALVDAGYTDKYVGQYAYNFHSDVPVDTTVHSNVIISAANGFLSGKYTFRELLQGWVDKGANKMGVYDYFSIYQWDLSKPRIAVAAYPRDLAFDTRDYYNLNARFHSAESGDSWAPHGLGYYVSNRVMWDVDEADNVEAMIDAFLTDMYGPAYTPMKEFYDLINEDKQLRSSDNVLTNMYYYLDNAVTAAGSNQAVLDRIYEMVKYTRYFELRTIYDEDNGNQSKKEALLTFVYRIRLNGLVHAFRIWSVFGLSDAALNDPDYYLKDSTAINEAEVLGFLSNGRSTFGDPPDPYPSFIAEEEIYSTDLVPAAVPMGLTHPAGDGVQPTDSQRAHHYFLWVDPCQTTITFDIEANPTGDTCYMKLFHSDHGYDPVDTLTFDSPAVGNTLRLTLYTSYTGLHEASLSGATGQSMVDWSPAGVSDGVFSTLQSSPYQASAHLAERFELTRFFAGYWRQFFYVPAGTTTIGFWATEPVGEIHDGGNNVVATYPDGYVDDWYEAAVPVGQDDKVWNMTSNRGVRLMTTVPPYFARTVDELLLPREVVYGVSPGAATNPSPANGASSVSTDAYLIWDVGQATASQELYFGASNPPAYEASLLGTDNSYDPGTLNLGTTYYWAVDADNVNGITAGAVWSFSTGGGGPGGGTFDNDSADGLWGTAINWSTDALPTLSDKAEIIGTADAEIAGTAAVAEKTVIKNGRQLTMSSGSLTTSDGGNQNLDIFDGTLSVSGGTLTVGSGNRLYVGITGGTGVLNVSGGKIVSPYLDVPHPSAGSTGTVNLSGGEIEVALAILFDQAGGSGTMDITGGGVLKLMSGSGAKTTLDNLIASGDIISSSGTLVTEDITGGAKAYVSVSCTSSTMHIEAATCAEVNCGQGKKNGETTITIYDNCGDPVENALVDGTFSGDFSETINNVSTNASGQAVFTSSGCVKKPVWSFTVDDVTGSLTYDSNDDVTTGCSE